MLRPNLLVLDEPTNNLDLEAVRALGEGAKEYAGAVLLASHDCAFVAETCNVVYYLFKVYLYDIYMISI
jgi:ATPase subunit of ABC transporter with duplicated ATPase domains